MRVSRIDPVLIPLGPYALATSTRNWSTIPGQCFLHCIEVPCTVLYCTVLYCTVLYCTVLYYSVLYCTPLFCSVQICTLLYTTLLCSTLLYSADTLLYCTVLYLVSQIYTMPEYLQERFGGTRMRVYLSCVQLCTYIFSTVSVSTTLLYHPVSRSTLSVR